MNNQMVLADIFSRSDLFVGIEEDKLSDIFSFGDRRVYEPGATLFARETPL
jgi:hypothetical protein